MSQRLLTSSETSYIPENTRNPEVWNKTCGVTLHRRWSFTFRISSVNVTKSAENCGFGHIYWWNPSWKTSTSCKKECTPGSVAWVNLWRNLFVMIRMRRKVVKLPVPAIKKAVNWFAMKCKLFGCRSSQWKRFIKQGVLKTFAKFTEEHLC